LILGAIDTYCRTFPSMPFPHFALFLFSLLLSYRSPTMPFTKRARKSSTASSRRVKPKTRSSLRQGESSASSQELKSYLDKLPLEIINEIWKHSREPSLIHTCRRLYETLPSWTHVTKCMATLAIIAPPTEDKDLETILHDLLVPIPGIERSSHLHGFNITICQRLSN
jgi:hypothetical protein